MEEYRSVGVGVDNACAFVSVALDEIEDGGVLVSSGSGSSSEEEGTKAVDAFRE